MPVRKAASVLPEPVGACTSTCAPVAITGQAASCAGVGPANARSNQERVAGVKAASGSILAARRTAVRRRRDRLSRSR